MLEDNKYKTYAVTKQKLAELNIREKKQIPKGEVPGCVIQELGYAIPFKEGIVIDPLTVFMLLEKEAEDPRIGIALDEMLEDYVW